MRSFGLALLATGTLLALSSCDRAVAGGSLDGAKVFSAACARCHGDQGRPDPGMVAKLGVKDLTSPELQKRLSDRDIREQIINGSKNKQMPSFDGALTPDQLDAIIKHVRTLSK